MKNVDRAILILLMLFIPSFGFAKMDCDIRDISGAKTEKEIWLLKLAGYDWMQNAKVCTLGEFEVAVPEGAKEKDSRIIFVFRKGKPVFYRDNGGTYIYSPKLEDAAIDKVLVHLWHGDDDEDIDRIWYQTIGKDPEIMIDDTNFDGQPDRKTIWKNRDIVEMYEWINNEWQRKELKNKKP